MRAAFLQATGSSAAPETPQLAALRALNSGAGPGGGQLPTEPERALPLLERLLRTPATPPGDQAPPAPEAGALKHVVIIDWAETLVPAADLNTLGVGDRTALITLERWGRDPRIMAS